MIAKPFSPGNAFPADEVAREHITFDKAMIGSCTNGSYDDLLQAALVLRAARAKGMTKVERELAVFPGSGGVGRQIEQPDPRLGGESIAEVFRSVGGGIRQSWCGPCFGQGPDALDERPARDHVVQPQLAEPDGPRRRRLPGQPGGCRRLGAPRLHGPALRAGARVGAGNVRRVTFVLLRAIAALAALSLSGQGPALVPLEAGMVIDRSVTIRPGTYRLSASPDHSRPAITIRGEISSTFDERSRSRTRS